MPFTASHPAAVLPLLRRPFVPVALIAGAVAPDLPYFVELPVTAQSWYEPFTNATFSHSWVGMLLVGLPGTVLLALLFSLVKRPVGDLFPFALEADGDDGKSRRGWPAFVFWFLISALIGLATHLVWDSITQEGRLLGVDLRFLHTNLWTGMTINRFLQHASTVLGLVVIVTWCVRRLRSGDVTLTRIAASRTWVIKRLAIVASIFLAGIAVAAFTVVETRNRDGALGLELTLAMILKSGIPVVVLGIMAYALAWHLVHLRRGASVRTE